MPVAVLVSAVAIGACLLVVAVTAALGLAVACFVETAYAVAVVSAVGPVVSAHAVPEPVSAVAEPVQIVAMADVSVAGLVKVAASAQVLAGTLLAQKSIVVVLYLRMRRGMAVSAARLNHLVLEVLVDETKATEAGRDTLLVVH